MPTFEKPTVPVLNVGSFLVDDLVMALPMAEGAGSALADLSGNGHDATIAGVEDTDFQWVDDPEMGIVLELLTASAWIDLAATLLTAYGGQSSATLQCWIKLASDAPAAGDRGLANFDNLSGASTRTLYPDDPGGANQIRSSVFRGGTRADMTLDGGVDRSEWHLLTITTQVGGQYLVYQDDILLSGVAAELTVALAAPLQFGRSDDSGGSDRLAGLVGDLRLYTRALQGFEVANIFSNPWGLYTFFNPPGQVDYFDVAVDWQPRGAASLRDLGLQTDLPVGATPGLGSFALLVDVEVGGVFNPPVALLTDLSPFNKPALGGAPAPALNGDPITTNLQLAILFNDPAGAADPLTDYANALSLSGITWETQAVVDGLPNDQHGYALSDQVTGAYANGDGGTIPDTAALRPTTDFSLCAMVYFTGAPSANGVLVGKLASGGTTYAYALRIGADNDRVEFEMTDTVDGQTTVLSPNNAIADPGLYVIVGTYDGAIMRLYINGVEVGTTANGGTLDHGSDPLGIGQDGLGAALVGGNAHSEADFLWDRALTPDEALGLAENPFGMFCDSGYVERFQQSVDWQPRGFASLNEFDLLADIPVGVDPGLGSFDLLADLAPGVTNAAGLTFFSITPVVGPDTGGQAVTIKGRNFQDITQVLIGGVVLGSLVVADENTITGVTPAHVAGAVNVRIDSSTLGFVEASLVYVFAGGFGPAVDQLILGKQIDESFWRQETFDGETAPLGIQTVLSLVLDDVPVHPDAVEVYVRRLDPGHGTTDDGGLLMRQGGTFTYTVDIGNRQIIWESTAQIEILPLDEITVAYLARGET